MKAKTEQNPFDSTICIVLDTLFNLHRHQDFKKAIKTGEQALQIGEHLNNKQILYVWSGKLSDIYREYEIYSVALDYAFREHKFFEGPDKNFNWWFINTGNIFFAAGNLEKADEYYKSAIEVFSEDTSSDKNSINGVAVAYANLGLIQKKKHKYDSAFVYFKKSSVIREKNAKLSSNIYMCALIAETYSEISKFDSTEIYLLKALSYDKQTDEHIWLSYINYLYADMYKKQGNYKMALDKLFIAEQKSIQFGNEHILLKTYKQILWILREQTQYEEAEKYAQKAVLQTKKFSNSRYKLELFKEISELYKEINKYERAYRYLENYIKLKDTLDSYKYSRLQNKYEIELNEATLKSIEKELEISNQTNVYYKYFMISGSIVLAILIVLFIIILKGRRTLKISNRKINNLNRTNNAQLEEITQQNEEITAKNDQLDEYKNHLEDKIKEQTKDLKDAKEHAERADELKTAFLNNLSHEIRTPLNAIVGFADVLNNIGVFETHEAKLVEYINNSSESLLNIVESIMKASEIEIGNVEIDLTSFNILPVLKELHEEITLSRDYLKKKELNFVLNTDSFSNNIKICTDKDIFKTVFSNLIDNAFKFTEKGKVEFGVFKDDEDIIQFYVSDTGIGIIDENAKFIFDKFRKIDSENSKLYRGLGLGLTNAKSMLDKLGGDIWFKSEVNNGTTFYFNLPKK